MRIILIQSTKFIFRWRLFEVEYSITNMKVITAINISLEVGHPLIFWYWEAVTCICRQVVKTPALCLDGDMFGPRAGA